MNKLVIPAVVLLVAFIAFAGYILVTTDTTRTPRVAAGDPAPDIALTGAFGGEGLLSDYQGRVILLNFWATWCAPCVTEMPDMQRLYEQLGDEHFEIIAVSLDHEGAGVVQRFAERHRLTFTLAIDPEGRSEQAYRLTGLPETYIIDADGIVRHRILGAREWTHPESRRLITELMPDAEDADANVEPGREAERDEGNDGVEYPGE